MTTRLPPSPCEKCGALTWMLSGQRQCRPCRFGWVVTANAPGGVESVGGTPAAQTRTVLSSGLGTQQRKKPQPPAGLASGPGAPIKIPSGRVLRRQDKQNRIERAARLAAMRAANTAKQRRAMGLPA
jgi:hypothetical protein